MTTAHNTIDRRAVLGAVLAGAIAPKLAFGQSTQKPIQEKPTSMRIRMTFGDQAMTAALEDNPSARDFLSMLPLNLSIEDYSTNEKIAYLPRKLTEEGSEPFDNERPYDLCYYTPWGNLAMFYDSYRHTGLIRLGRFDEGYEALHVRGKFPLRIDVL